MHVFFHWIWSGVMSDNSQEHRNVLAGFAFVNFISPLVRNLPDAMGNPGCWGDNLELQMHFGLPSVPSSHLKYIDLHMIFIWSNWSEYHHLGGVIEHAIQMGCLRCFFILSEFEVTKRLFGPRCPGRAQTLCYGEERSLAWSHEQIPDQGGWSEVWSSGGFFHYENGNVGLGT